MHSGLTVEVANTDAEGRFLLSDGLSWLARVKGVKWLLDAATLTGHSVGTGKAHAGVVSNRSRPSNSSLSKLGSSRATTSCQ